ncbi:MAG TPA: hypothetical protein VHD59_17140 [Pseudolabrys sp.]|nr:hypothetical protein [Pseudolabrys sp.]
MTRPLFRPDARILALLTALGAAALGCSFYMRYLGVQNTEVGLACQAGLDSLFCTLRRLTIALYEHSIFGIVALGAALINLLRPTVSLFALALVAAGLGTVLYNVALSGLAVAVLILSFARPAATSE